MSSETNRDNREDGRDDERDDEIEKKISEALTIGVPVATVGLAIVAGVVVDVATAILVLAGGALIAVIAMFWGSLRTLIGETPLSGADAYALGAPPRAEEEQKRAVLRALKDLEFERSVGKISEEDYRGLVTKYRAEAKRLLQLLDEDAAPGRERAEAMLQRRLRQAGLIEAAEDEANKEEEDAEAKEPEVEDEDDDLEEAEAPKPAEEKPAPPPEATRKKKTAKKAKKAGAENMKKADAKKADCASCGTSNEEDALFCKKCGARLKAEEKPAETTSESTETDEETEAS